MDNSYSNHAITWIHHIPNSPYGSVLIVWAVLASVNSLGCRGSRLLIFVPLLLFLSGSVGIYKSIIPCDMKRA
ncbi:hypothetical protein F4813DRAFT_342378 [Daldinia decipiens]|uniref:uncharacterized protein n=1 Tax=Daldinia decipiens TaxID=326647 RepID=UPI0020C26BFB|nr:uncharacterized protein F4813DRAFT_342378 [Daldinia decipiens]KAI1662928.1 hypothetical protein F4813DRAFT_342378 [Daldinia decipiens]